MPEREPRYKITWWIRFRSRIRRLRSPLRLRGSIVRLRHQHPRHPYIELIRLFVVDLQLPSLKWSYDFPLPKPLAPEDIAGNEALFDLHHPNIYDLRDVPIWMIRDSPLRALYRMYELFMTQESYLLRFEFKYIWRHVGRKWDLCSIPDPKDTDPIRYAMLASIAEEMVIAFNWRLALGSRRDGNRVDRTLENPTPPFDPETAPQWTVLVPAVQPEDLHKMPPDMVRNGRLFLGEGESTAFLRRNIIAGVGYFYSM